jgi:hypothetical protein
MPRSNGCGRRWRVVAVEVVKRKVAAAEERLQAAELRAEHAQASGEVADRDLAAFYLFLAIQEAIDLAAHWVADAGWPAPAEAGLSWCWPTTERSTATSRPRCKRQLGCAIGSHTSTPRSITDEFFPSCRTVLATCGHFSPLSPKPPDSEIQPSRGRAATPPPAAGACRRGRPSPGRRRGWGGGG